MAERQLIDWHVHCSLPEHFPPGKSRAEWDRLNMPDQLPDTMRKAMDQVDRYVIIGMQWGPGRKNIPNDFIAEQVALSNGKALGFASVYPYDDGAPAEFERAIKTLGLNGLKLSPAYQGFDPRMEKAMPLYEMAEKFGVPLMVHAAATYNSESTLETSNPILFDPIMRTFPNLKLIIAHLGQPWMAETVMLMRKHGNVFTDLSARYGQTWQLYNGLTLATEYKVTNKILFGTDFSVDTPESAMRKLRGINRIVEGTNLPKISDELVDQIIYERPLSLLGLG
jgi:hypothetical protein